MVAIDATPVLGARRALTGRPLLDTRQDMALYLRRRDVEQPLATALARGLNVLVDADRGGGKTTLLHALQFDARRSSTGRTGSLRFIYLGAGAAPSAAAVLARVLRELRGEGNPTWATGLDTATALADLETFCAGERLDREHGVCVLLDDVDPLIGHQLFGVLRDDLWRMPLQWVVTVESRMAARLIAPPADAFFDVRLTLAPLSRQEALDLIGRRLGRDLSDFKVDTLPTSPRRLVRLAATTPPEEWAAGEAAFDSRLDAAATIGHSAVEVVQALADLGPVSPSDDRLLARLGWTRARASQVLRALLERGLVTYRDVPAARPGRPNRIYELSPDRALPA